VSKILGWFRNQRTAVGKLYKKKSGQGAAPLTKRQRWQESNFAFLREAIEPRTYTRDTASVSLLLASNSCNIFQIKKYWITLSILVLHLLHVVCFQIRSGRSGRSEDEEERLSSVSASAGDTQEAEPRPGTSRGTSKRSTTLEQAMVSYLKTRREAPKAPEPLFDPTDERQAFGSWFTSRLHRVAEDR